MTAINSTSLSDRSLLHVQSRHSLPEDHSQCVSRSFGSDLACYDLGSHHRVAAKKRRDDYKPLTLRMPFLSALLVSLLVMIGLLAYSLHALPRKDIGDSLLDLGNGAAERRGLHHINRRATAIMPLIMTTTDNNSKWTMGATNDDSTATATHASSVIKSSITKAYTPLRFARRTGTVFAHAMNSSAFADISTSITKSSTSISVPIGISTLSPQTTTSTAFPDISTTITKSSTSTSSPTRTSTFSSGTRSSSGSPVTGSSITKASTSLSPSETVTTVPESTAASDGSGVIDTSVTSGTPTESEEASGVVRTNTRTQSDATPTVDTALSDGLWRADPSVTVPVVTHAIQPIKTSASSEGVPRFTVPRFTVASDRLSPTTATLVNSAGSPTTTITTDFLVTTVFSTVSNNIGDATTTVVPYPTTTASTENAQVFYISPAEYFVGFCLPTLLSIIIAIPIRTLGMNARLFQPWHALTQPSGAMGFESLALSTCDFKSYSNGLGCLLDGQFLIFLTTILMICSVLLVPLSTVSIVLELRGNCAPGTAKGCTFQLCVSEIPAKAAIALLACMCFLVIMIAVCLWKWKTGVYTNPWNICGVASLTQNKDIRALLTQNLRKRYRLDDSVEDLLSAAVANRRFELGWFRGEDNKMQYGVMLGEHHSDTAHLCRGSVEVPEDISPEAHKSMNSLPFMLGYTGRLLFLAFLAGLLALILYYNNTGDDTAFERFMDSQSFGTIFLFTSVGTILSQFWSSFVSGIALISPYQLLAQRPQKAKHSILLSPATNAFSSILSGIRRRHVLLAAVGMTAVLSEFLTIFLANVPYRASQTFLAARICAYGSIGVIATMMVVVASSLFIRWPHMPVDPSTIAGAMYYVCDSWMLCDFKHLGEMRRNDCNMRMNAIGQSYTFGEFIGQSGTKRIGIDRINDEQHV